MVALSGARWRLAPGLVACVNEADRIAPRRSEASDGSIGDTSHAARSSFHNPSGGYVDALDLTHDPAHGFDAHARARMIAARADPRIDHLISNRRIWSAARPYWRMYFGINGHTRHAHIATKRVSWARNDTRPWWLATAPPAPPPPTPPPIPRSKDDDVFFYDTDDDVLVQVAGGKQVRITGQQYATNCRAHPNYLGVAPDSLVVDYRTAYGAIIQ